MPLEGHVIKVTTVMECYPSAKYKNLLVLRARALAKLYKLTVQELEALLILPKQEFKWNRLDLLFSL